MKEINSDLEKCMAIIFHYWGEFMETTLSRHDLPNNLRAKEIHLFTNIKLRTVYDLMNKSPEHGGIPSFRVGKSIFSNREEFLLWWDRTINTRV